jgi:hypothetical protein
MRWKSAVLLLTVLIGAPLLVQSSELDDLLSGFDTEENASGGADVDIDELLSGFDDQETMGEGTEETAPSSLPAWLAIKGSLSLRSAINFAHDPPPPGTPDYRGLSMFRGLGELVTDFSFEEWRGRIGGTAFYDAAYHLNGQRDLYSDEYLDEYEREIELGEAYLQGSLADDLDIKIGRQIVVWGKSDNLRVNDVLNPLDLRWPGMTDIRYLRLPVTMTKLDYYVGDWNSSFIVVNEPRFAKTPVYNGEFYQGNQPAPELKTPGWSLENQQPALSVNGIFSGWDLSFYGAWVYPEKGSVERDLSGIPYRTYDKALLAGTAVNVALGNWLMKAEAAYWDDLTYTNIEDKKPRLDILAGIEYSGFTETAITLEIVNRHIFDYDKLLAEPPDAVQEDTMQYALRFTRDFAHDTLHLNIVVASYGLWAEDGGFERVQLDYDLNDEIVLSGGVILYESGDIPGFAGVGDNDNVFVEVEYNF